MGVGVKKSNKLVESLNVIVKPGSKYLAVAGGKLQRPTNVFKSWYSGLKLKEAQRDPGYFQQLSELIKHPNLAVTEPAEVSDSFLRNLLKLATKMPEVAAMLPYFFQELFVHAMPEKRILWLTIRDDYGDTLLNILCSYIGDYEGQKPDNGLYRLALYLVEQAQKLVDDEHEPARRQQLIEYLFYPNKFGWNPLLQSVMRLQLDLFRQLTKLSANEDYVLQNPLTHETLFHYIVKYLLSLSKKIKDGTLDASRLSDIQSQLDYFMGECEDSIWMLLPQKNERGFNAEGEFARKIPDISETKASPTLNKYYEWLQVFYRQLAQWTSFFLEKTPSSLSSISPNSIGSASTAEFDAGGSESPTTSPPTLVENPYVLFPKLLPAGFAAYGFGERWGPADAVKAIGADYSC